MTFFEMYISPRLLFLVHRQDENGSEIVVDDREFPTYLRVIILQ